MNPSETSTRAELIERYASGAELIRLAVAGLSREQILARPIAGKWSVLEVVAHLADFEIIGVDRLTAVIAEQNPKLPGRDEQNYVERLVYHQRELDEQLGIIDLCRRHVTRILRTLADDDWARRGIHTEAGPLSLELLLGRVVKHVEHHVPFIHEKRKALGV